MTNQGDGDKRSVTTDALETLGQIISENEKRDAIHLAVEPVIATEKLYPGQDVGANGTTKNPVGIVDPFLKSPVFPGQRFWLVVYPRQIHSLRHVWTHPAFDDEKENPKSFKAATPDPTVAAREWIEEYADDIGLDYNTLMTGWIKKTFG